MFTKEKFKEIYEVLTPSQKSFLEVLIPFITSLEENILSQESYIEINEKTLDIYLQHKSDINTRILFIIQDYTYEIYSNNFKDVNAYNNVDNYNIQGVKLNTVLEYIFKGRYKNLDYYYKNNVIKSEMIWNDDLLRPIIVYSSLYSKVKSYFIKEKDFVIKEEYFKNFMSS